MRSGRSVTAAEPQAVAQGADATVPRRRGRMARTHGFAATGPPAVAFGAVSAAGLVVSASDRHLVDQARWPLAEDG